MDGIPYDINFKQNFSTMYYDGQLIMNLPVSYIIETIDNPEANMIVFDVNNYLPSGEEYRCSIEFKEQFEEFTKKEKKDKQKWKRNKKKRQANTKRLLKEIDNGKFFIKDRR